MCFSSAEFNCFIAAHHRQIELWSSNATLRSRSQHVESSKSLEQPLLLYSHTAWAQTLKQDSIKQTKLTELTLWWHKSYCFPPCFLFSFFFLLLFGCWGFLFIWFWVLWFYFFFFPPLSSLPRFSKLSRNLHKSKVQIFGLSQSVGARQISQGLCFHSKHFIEL